MAKIKKKDDTKCCQVCRVTETVVTAGGNVS